MILYIGNKLSKHGNTATSVETLGPLLAQNYEVLCVSDKRSKVSRLVDITSSILRNRKRTKLVFVDTYSTQGFYFAVISAFISRLIKIPVVLLLRGGNLELRLRNSPTLSKWLFAGASRLVAPSYFLYETFKRYGFDNVVYIPNNIKLDDYCFVRRESFSPKLLWVRSFNNIYNPTMAVDLVKHLSKAYQDVELCMVGPEKDGSLSVSIEYAKSLGVEERIKFTGKLEKRDWHSLSQHYNLFVNTANVDNTPVSVIESMALGLPVVSTKAGGIPYLIEHNTTGLLVEVGDVMGMVKEIRRIVEAPSLGITLAANARAKVEEFNWENVRNDWSALVKQFM